jgi:outer membrane protein OmpA-like peptidoglycan-associated protein
MIRIILLTVGVTAGMILFCWSAQAEDFNFETTSEGIVQKLTGAHGGAKTRGIRGGKWEDAFETDGLSPSRAIKVIRKDEDREVWDTVIAPERRTGRYINLKVAFDVDSYAIRPDSFVILNELGKALKDPRLKDRVLMLNGHTDSDGPSDYNLRLSLNRAQAVKQYLVINRSVAPDRLIVYGYGENMPLRPNSSAANKQLNRRVEIVVSQ